MRKKILTLCLATIMTVCMAGIGNAAKIKCKGEVTKNDAGELVIKLDGDCPLGVGDKIKIQPQKKGVEGC